MKTKEEMKQTTLDQYFSKKDVSSQHLKHSIKEFEQSGKKKLKLDNSQEQNVSSIGENSNNKQLQSSSESSQIQQEKIHTQFQQTDVYALLKSIKNKVVDHTKAKKLILDDNFDSITHFVEEYLLKAPGAYTLSGLINSLSSTYAHYEQLEGLAILEAIHDALKKQSNFIQQHISVINPMHDTDDQLFTASLSRMLYIAYEYNNNELVGLLQEVYDL